MFSVDRGAVLEVFASVAYSAPKIFAMSPKVPDSPVPVVGLQSSTTTSPEWSFPLGLKLQAAVESVVFATFASSEALVAPAAAAAAFLDSQISIAKHPERPAPQD